MSILDRFEICTHFTTLYNDLDQYLLFWPDISHPIPIRFWYHLYDFCTVLLASLIFFTFLPQTGIINSPKTVSQCTTPISFFSILPHSTQFPTIFIRFFYYFIHCHVPDFFKTCRTTESLTCPGGWVHKM